MRLSPSGTAPVGVISPHLDDAVLSCGRLLMGRPDSHVVTVFSAGPARVDPLTPWDKRAGCFKRGDDVMEWRRREDNEALTLASARAHHLPFWDEQYRRGAMPRFSRWSPRAGRDVEVAVPEPGLAQAVQESLRAVVSELDLEAWLIPLGLGHSDHRLVAQSCLRLASEMPDLRWVVYEELPYRLTKPLEVPRERARIAAEGFTLEPIASHVGADVPAKEALVKCYRSQLKPLGERIDMSITGAETFHHLVWETVCGNR